MYSLIVTGHTEAWNGRRFGFPRARFGEHTAAALYGSYAALDEKALTGLRLLPTLLAHEKGIDLPARVARITRFAHASGDELRFEYEFVDGISPISTEILSELASDLDIGRYEMTRTHWAIKDVDLISVLEEAGPADRTIWNEFWTNDVSVSGRPTTTSTIFSVPTEPKDPNLVAVMMSFRREFEEVYLAIGAACAAVGLSCKRADDVWDESTVIQDVFNLIYRSAITIVDLSDRNSNVMYETGIAHALGRPVIPLAQGLDNLPFDLAHHRILTYLPNAEGLAVMQRKLERRLRTLSGR